MTEFRARDTFSLKKEKMGEDIFYRFYPENKNYNI